VVASASAERFLWLWWLLIRRAGADDACYHPRWVMWRANCHVSVRRVS